MAFFLPPSKTPSSVALGRRRWAIVWALAAALLSIYLYGSGARASVSGPGPSYWVIVNPTNASPGIERAFASQAFLKKAHRWPDGQIIWPVDLSASSPVRRRWSEGVIGRSVEAVKSYWQQMIFAGRDLPPPELESEDEVVTFVLRSHGAIGYVSAGTALRGAKVIPIW
jgi:hypothetical protein